MSGPKKGQLYEYHWYPGMPEPAHWTHDQVISHTATSCEDPVITFFLCVEVYYNRVLMLSDAGKTQYWHSSWFREDINHSGRPGPFMRAVSND